MFKVTNIPYKCLISVDNKFSSFQPLHISFVAYQISLMLQEGLKSW